MPRLLVSLRLLALLPAALTVLTTGAAEEAAPAELAPEPTQIERPLLPSRSDSAAASLRRQLPADEFVSLKAGADDFVALWRPANVGAPKGLVILVPGEGESADWPRGIGPLRRGLPDHGWHTLSLSLPDSRRLILADIPAESTERPTERADAEGEAAAADEVPSEAGYLPEQTAAPAGEPALDGTETDTDAQPAAPAQPELRHEEQVAQRIQAAVDFARGRQPAAIVLLGQGTGGYWAARYLQQSTPPDVRHLLVIQPRQPDDQDEPLGRLLPSLNIPTGDLFYKDDASQRSAARERLDASRRNRHPAYRQIGLQPLNGDTETQQEQLLRRARGWLDPQF